MSIVTTATLVTTQHAYDFAQELEERDRSISRPTVIISDVRETLLDLTTLGKSVGKALYGREDLLPLFG